MAGLGQRFIENDVIQSQETINFQQPKPFVKAGDQFIIDHLVQSFPAEWKLFFVIQNNFPQQYKDYLVERGQIIETTYSERGPIDSVLAALPRLKSDEPCIVSYCDYTLVWNGIDFENQIKKSQIDGAIVGIKGFHSTYSGPNTYCHYQVEGDYVIELKEKELYTDHIEKEWTSCGLYYFKSPTFLKECLDLQIKQKLNYKNGEFYISQALQAALNVNRNLKILNYPIKYFIQLGTPYDVKMYNYWKNIFNIQSKNLLDKTAL